MNRINALTQELLKVSIYNVYLLRNGKCTDDLKQSSAITARVWATSRPTALP